MEGDVGSFTIPKSSVHMLTQFDTTSSFPSFHQPDAALAHVTVDVEADVHSWHEARAG